MPPIDCYRHFITDEIICLMVHETNRYAEQCLQTREISRRSNTRQRKPTTDEEMLKFFGIIIEIGLVQMPKLSYYRSSSQLYGFVIIRRTMPREKFELLLKLWYFANNNEKHPNKDRLFKLGPSLDLLKARFSSAYICGSVITSDETMVPWRGRRSFKKYIPREANKYGVKIYKVAVTNRYTWSFMVYTGQQNPTAGLGHAQTVVMNLLDDLLRCYRTSAAGNFVTSISLAKSLLEDDAYPIEILRSNRTGSGNEVRREKLRRGEVYGCQNREGIKLLLCRDKRDVLMISFRPSHSATLVNTRKTSIQDERIMKP